jgi:hypothetical protein
MRDLRVPMKAFCTFLGIFLAEGWVRADRNDVIVSQSSGSRHLGEIHQILAATGLHWDYDAQNGKFTTSHLTLARWLRENCGSRAWGKRVPREFLDLPLQLLGTLLHGMMLGDGHWSREEQRRYTTTSAQLADDMQEIFQKLGRDAWVRQQDLSPYGGGEVEHGRAIRRTGRMQYVVHERMGDYHWLPKPKMTEYHGRVYCVTVPSGTVYVRRNGKAIWCGDTTGVTVAPAHWRSRVVLDDLLPQGLPGWPGISASLRTGSSPNRAPSRRDTTRTAATGRCGSAGRSSGRWP